MIEKDLPNYKWIYTYDYAPDSLWDPWRDEVYGDHGNVGDEALQESGYNGPQKAGYRASCCMPRHSSCPAPERAPASRTFRGAA